MYVSSVDWFVLEKFVGLKGRKAATCVCHSSRDRLLLLRAEMNCVRLKFYSAITKSARNSIKSPFLK